MKHPKEHDIDNQRESEEQDSSTRAERGGAPTSPHTFPASSEPRQPREAHKRRNVYDRRLYRLRSFSTDLVPFRVQIKESDLLILARKDLTDSAIAALKAVRAELEEWISRHPEFAASFVPLEVPAGQEPGAVVRAMYEAGRTCGVGPMAAVAGAVAEAVGTALLAASKEVIVENGGDIFAVVAKERVAQIFAGTSPFSDRLGIKLAPGTRCGVCTSSATVGPSVSFGKADAVVVVADSAALADAAATAIGNRVRAPEDISEALDFSGKLPIRGAVIIIGDVLAARGEIELVELS